MSKKKQKYANWKWNLRDRFCCCSNLSNDDIFTQMPGLKKDFTGKPGNTPNQEFPGVLRPTSSTTLA